MENLPVLRDPEEQAEVVAGLPGRLEPQGQETLGSVGSTGPSGFPGFQGPEASFPQA